MLFVIIKIILIILGVYLIYAIGNVVAHVDALVMLYKIGELEEDENITGAAERLHEIYDDIYYEKLMCIPGRWIFGLISKIADHFT